MNERHRTAAASAAAVLLKKKCEEAFPAEYLAPEVSICVFAPEMGFALSVCTESLSTGFHTGETMEIEYEITSGTTEGVENAGTF